MKLSHLYIMCVCVCVCVCVSQPSCLFPDASRGPQGRMRCRKRSGTTVPACTRLRDPGDGCGAENRLGSPSQVVRTTGERITCDFTGNPGASVPICADADGPSLPFSSQTRLGVPGGGCGAESGLEPRSQTERVTGESIVCGRTANPGALASICVDFPTVCVGYVVLQPARCFQRAQNCYS